MNWRWRAHERIEFTPDFYARVEQLREAAQAASFSMEEVSRAIACVQVALRGDVAPLDAGAAVEEAERHLREVSR